MEEEWGPREIQHFLEIHCFVNFYTLVTLTLFDMLGMTDDDEESDPESVEILIMNEDFAQRNEIIYDYGDNKRLRLKTISKYLALHNCRKVPLGC